MIRFCVQDEDTFGDPYFLGQATIPVRCLKPGRSLNAVFNLVFLLDQGVTDIYPKLPGFLDLPQKNLSVQICLEHGGRNKPETRQVQLYVVIGVRVAVLFETISLMALSVNLSIGSKNFSLLILTVFVTNESCALSEPILQREDNSSNFALN